MGDLHDTVESDGLPRFVSAAIREIGGRLLLMPNVVRLCEMRETVSSLPFLLTVCRSLRLSC